MWKQPQLSWTAQQTTEDQPSITQDPPATIILEDLPTVSPADAITKLPPSKLRRERAPKQSKKELPLKRKNQESPTNSPKKIKTQHNFVAPVDRLKSYPKSQTLYVQNERIFCEACHKILTNNKDTIDKHLKSKKHGQNLLILENQALQRESLCDYVSINVPQIGVGATLPPPHNAFRIHVVSEFLKAGLPLHSIDSLRSLLEENSKYSLTDSSHLATFCGDVLNLEFARLKSLLSSGPFVAIMDGVTHRGEILGIVIRFWSERRILQLGIAYKHSDLPLDQRYLAGLFRLGLQNVSQDENALIGIIHDEASVNFRMCQNFKNCSLFPNFIELICWCHVCSNAGDQFSTPVVSKFLIHWQALVGHSPLARRIFQDLTSVKCPYITNFTRWYVRFEVIIVLWSQQHNLVPFLHQFELRQKPTESTTALLAILQGSQSKTFKFELALMKDYGEPLITTTYQLESDSPMCFLAYDILQTLKNKYQLGLNIFAQTSTFIQSVSQVNGSLHPATASGWKRQLEDSIAPVRKYLNMKLSEKPPVISDPDSMLKVQCEYQSIMILKICRLLNPFRFCDLNPSMEFLLTIPTFLPFISRDQTKLLFSEGPAYKALAFEFNTNGESYPNLSQSIIEFFLRHANDFPTWFFLFQRICLLQPHSCGVERLNAVFARVIGEEQQTALEETIESRVLMAYNHR
jgi:hypothetical protein